MKAFIWITKSQAMSMRYKKTTRQAQEGIALCSPRGTVKRCFRIVLAGLLNLKALWRPRNRTGHLSSLSDRCFLMSSMKQRWMSWPMLQIKSQRSGTVSFPSWKGNNMKGYSGPRKTCQHSCSHGLVSVTFADHTLPAPRPWQHTGRSSPARSLSSKWWILRTRKSTVFHCPLRSQSSGLCDYHGYKTVIMVS